MDYFESTDCVPAGSSDGDYCSCLVISRVAFNIDTVKNLHMMLNRLDFAH